jgi:hypothetical protein
MTDAQPTISAHADPEGEAPWAMQIVVHIPKQDPPTTTELCGAVAVAVAKFLYDERSLTGEWRPMIERWGEGRIRKLVRRARGAAWEKAQIAPGETYREHNCDVRVCVPAPTNELAPELARLQVEGLKLLDPSPNVTIHPRDEGDWGIDVYMNPEWGLELHPGKSAAQCAHAVQVALLHMDPQRRQEFFAVGTPVTLTWPNAEDWATVLSQSTVKIVDAGFTVLPRPGTTACALY